MELKKCACIDSLYGEIPFLERFAAAQRDGFAFVEFWSWTDRNLDDIRKAAEDAGIGISGFNGDASYSLIDPSHKKPYMEFLERSAEAALKINARSVTIHSNALGDGGVIVNHYNELSYDLKLCSMYDMLLDCAKLAERSGVNMNLEALNITTDHVGNFLVHTSTAAEMTRLIGSPRLKILFDAYHMQLNEGSLCDNIKAYCDQIGHVHIADAPGRHEPGTGEIYYPHVYDCLEQEGYTGLLGYELFPKTTTAEAVKAIMSY